LFFTFYFFLSTLSFAQEVNTEFAQRMNHAFAQLEKNRVPHKLLLDYAMEFTHLPAYNGVLTNDNYTHTGTYKAIYNTLLMAQIQTGVPDMYSPESFKKLWNGVRNKQNINQPRLVLLSGLYYKYSKFRDDAVTSGKLQVINDQFKDRYINNVWQNPYEEKQVFAMAPPLMHIRSLVFKVSIHDDLFFSNQDQNIMSIAVDFGTGAGYQTMTWGQVRTLSYSSPGIYEWKYRLTLTGGQVLYSHSKIKITGNATFTANLADIPVNPPANICSNTMNIAASEDYMGIYGKGKLQVRYAQCDGIIRKPLIIAEGFDPAIFEPENPNGVTDLEGFLGSINFLFDSTLPDTIDTYDIIYVNWEDSFAHIQRNAYLLKEVIRFVNANKQGNLKNVVLGQSMGGLVARYALKDMEDHSEDHKTRLYISHDAPHLGANIPVSFQYMDRHVYNQFIQSPLLEDLVISLSDDASILYDVQTMLDAPSARQMLINYVNSNYQIDNSWHNAWQTELKNKGYPQQTRNIAISNGNHCASPQGFNPGDELFNMNGNTRTGWLSDIILTAIPTLNSAIWGLAGNITYEPGFLLGMLPGNNKMSVNFWAKALPQSGIQQIYKGKITYTKKLLWLININVNITDRNLNSPSNTLPYDYYTGGKYDVGVDFQDESYSSMFVSYNITANMTDHFSFIPTLSALDVGKGNASLVDFDYKQVYTATNPPLAPKDIPFDNFTTSYTPNSNLNEQHISFNTRNGNWLAAELNNVAEIFDCSFICDNVEIYGSAACSTGAAFSVPYSPDATYYWYVTQGSDIVSLSNINDSTVQLNFNDNVSGQITLNVSFGNSSCGYRELVKTLWIGKPKIWVELESDMGGISNYAKGYLRGVNSDIMNQNINSITWTTISTTDGGHIYGSSNSYEVNGQGPNNYWTVNAKVGVTNPCGLTEHNFVMTPPPCPLPPEFRFEQSSEDIYTIMLFPIPCDGYGRIASVYDSNAVIKIYDINGNTVFETFANFVNVSTLKPGVYFIKTIINGVTLTKQIIK